MYKRELEALSGNKFKYTVLSMFSDYLLIFSHAFAALRSLLKLSIQQFRPVRFVSSANKKNFARIANFG